MSRRGTLTRQGIVEAAMAMLDEGDERRFSMRRLAAELGVDPMALYHHHRNRHALMQEVMVALMAACPIPPSAGDWRQDVRAICHGIRQLARRHPGTFRVYVVFEDWVPSEHRVHEALYATLLEAGFGETATVRAVRLLLSYAESFAVDEITGWLEPFSAQERSDLADSLAGGTHPAITALLDTIVTPDADAEFAFGLDVLIAGLERMRETA